MLLEATQSQQVRAGQPKLNFFKSAVSAPAAAPTENKGRKALILFEDIDIVFEDQGNIEKEKNSGEIRRIRGWVYYRLDREKFILEGQASD